MFPYHTRTYINDHFCRFALFRATDSNKMFDHRLVEGQPLHYFYYYNPYPGFNCHPMEMQEDLIIPNSPNSTQSDSDNSLSSIEVSPKPIRARTVIQHTPKLTEVRCCWKNCGEGFDSLDQLAIHVKWVHASSGPGGLFYCGWEGCTRNSKGFNARYKMLVHVRTHTNEKPHQCCQCDKSFSRAENLKIHSRSHSGEKPYVCPVPGCNKAYSNSSDRFKHTRTHQVEKPYHCKVPGCPKRYTDPSSLRKHVKTYKHFVHDKVNDENVADKKEKMQARDESHSCDCTHMCCVPKANEILTFGLINFRREQICALKPYYSPTRQEVLVSYDQDRMDVDAPLDLSTNRRLI